MPRKPVDGGRGQHPAPRGAAAGRGRRTGGAGDEDELRVGHVAVLSSAGGCREQKRGAESERARTVAMTRLAEARTRRSPRVEAPPLLRRPRSILSSRSSEPSAELTSSLSALASTVLACSATVERRCTEARAFRGRWSLSGTCISSSSSPADARELERGQIRLQCG